MDLASSARRVLVVDDNRDAADMLCVWLELEGHTAAAAYSGAAALELAKDFRPHVAVLDLNMPGIDGFETARALAELLPVTLVALSADSSAKTADRLRNSGFSCRLVKPASTSELLAAIQGYKQALCGRPLSGSGGPRHQGQ